MAKKPKHKKGERWGKKREDKRDWKKYNEELVVRGEFLLDLDWVKSWNKELREMNAGKRGKPYEFPNSLIELQAVWNQWVSVSGIEGITRRLVAVAQLPAFNDYSTINRRVQKIEPCFQLPKYGFCSVSNDGSNFKMHNAGEYRKTMYGGKRRRWVKVIISANPLTKELLDVDVQMDGEGDSEPEIAMKHLNNLWSFGVEIDKFWGDGAYDTKELFNLLERHGTESAIPPRDNASKNSDGSMRRLREVFEYQTKTWEEWARDKQYGKRWLGTEGMFSSIKGIFGEHTRAKKTETACLEVERKFWAYDRMSRYGKAKD